MWISLISDSKPSLAQKAAFEPHLYGHSSTTAAISRIILAGILSYRISRPSPMPPAAPLSMRLDARASLKPGVLIRLVAGRMLGLEKALKSDPSPARYLPAPARGFWGQILVVHE